MKDEVRRLAIALLLGAVMLAPVVVPAAPAAASAAVKISAVYFSGTTLNKEYVVVRNASSRTLNLTGWKLVDKTKAGLPSNVFKFPTFKLGHGKSVRIHTGKGTNTRTDLYWGFTHDILGSADAETLENKAGRVVSRCSWSAGATSPKFC